MTLSLPNQLANRAASFNETSYGVNRVTLVLADGRRIHEVYLGWGRDIVKIENRVVARPEELDFRLADIVDVVSEVR